MEDTPHALIQNAGKLFHLYLQYSNQLLSDRTIVDNDNVKVVTTSGASLMSDSVMNSLRQCKERQVFHSN